LHLNKYSRCSHIGTGIAFDVRICVTYQCKFIGSEKIDPVILVAFTAHHTHVFALGRLTWDFMQTSQSLLP